MRDMHLEPIRKYHFLPFVKGGRGDFRKGRNHTPSPFLCLPLCLAATYAL